MFHAQVNLTVYLSANNFLTDRRSGKGAPVSFGVVRIPGNIIWKDTDLFLLNNGALPVLSFGRRVQKLGF